MVSKARGEGPELGMQTRLDVVCTEHGDYELEWVNVAGGRSICEPMSSKDMRRAICRISAALRKASAHERDPVQEWANIQRFLAEIDEDYAKPDYPRHLLVTEVKELREDLAEAQDRSKAFRTRANNAEGRVAQLERGPDDGLGDIRW